MSLSILCVTRAEPHALPFIRHLALVAFAIEAELVIAADRVDDVGIRKIKDASPEVVVRLEGKGYIESILDEAISHCSGDYILRMDDDERCSLAMVQWMAEKKYESAQHWKFCTANLWGNDQSIILNPPLWPDHHTRLSLKALSGGRHSPHAGSPFGGGELAPVIHEHHKFLVKTEMQRRLIALRYDTLGQGYGTADNMRPFSLPETCYDELTLAPLGDGTVREWEPRELRTVKMERVPL